MGSDLILLPLFILFGGTLLLPLLRERAREVFSFFLPLVSFFLIVILPFLIPLPQNRGWFTFDIITVIFGGVFTFVGSISLLYAIPYLRKERFKNEFYTLTVVLIASLTGVSYTKNLLLLYIFWEFVAISTWRLVGFYRDKRITRIADKTFLMTFLGSTLMLVGILILFKDYGTFDLKELASRSISSYPFFLILAGALAKSATLPLHTWLPDAHPVAPSPMSAILSGIVAKLGILLFIRTAPLFYHTLWKPFLLLALFSSLGAGAGALFAQDMKRVIAYSTVSQLGFIFMGLALFTPLGWIGAILFFLAHSLAKGGLFLSAGIVEKLTGNRNLDKLGGLARSMPVTAFSFALASASIMGFPPGGAFFPKLMVIMGIVREGLPGVAMGAVASAILTLLYLVRLVSRIFGGEEVYSGVKEGAPLMLLGAFVLGLTSLLVGFLIPYLTDYLNTILRTTIGGSIW